MARAKRHVVAFIADLHCNSLLGLLNPKTVLKRDDDGVLSDWTPNLTPAQEWLWNGLLQDVRALSKFVGKDTLTLAVAGDVTNGVKHLSESVSTRPSDQVSIATQVLLEPIRMLSPQLKQMYVVKGTDAHEMLAGSLAILVGDSLRKKVSIETLYHPLLKFGNQASIDLSHHGPAPGVRAWLRGNEVRYYVRDIMIRSVEKGETPPSAVVRAHKHQYTATIVEVQSAVQTFFTLGLILPAYSLVTSHARQAASSPQSIKTGIIALEIVDGKMNLLPWESLHYLDLRTERNVK